jgi:ribose 5-phosphate isomerase B
MHSLEELTRFVDVFLHTPYSNGDRHDRRLGQIMQYERTGNLPPLPESALKARP